jgi:GT2 family glycosyltransferase
MMPLTVTAVVLAYGPEPWLQEAVTAVLASDGVDLDVVVVDNGCTSGAIDLVKGLDRVRVITPESNTGYAGGCDRGAAEATGDYLAFVNSDAIVAPGALSRLADVASEPAVGLAMGSIRLAETPDLINTAGNPLHYTGLSWAGAFGEPAARHAHRRQVTLASGCCFAIRRDLWNELGGFAEEYFAYCEDTELSLRIWQRGLTVEYIPDAVVVHHYEFSRNNLKFYLLERNRAIVLLTTYAQRSLAVLAPMLLLTELLMLGAAIAGGWGRAKIRGWHWLWQHRGWLRARRALIQGQRAVPDAVIFRRVTARIDPANVAAPPGVGILNAVMGAYWLAARRLL